MAIIHSVPDDLRDDFYRLRMQKMQDGLPPVQACMEAKRTLMRQAENEARYATSQRRSLLGTFGQSLSNVGMMTQVENYLNALIVDSLAG